MVQSFKYLGAIISDLGSKPEILSRTAQKTAALSKLKTIWNERNISLSSKIRLEHSLVLSIFLYACESWALTTDIEKRIQATDMRCIQKLLCISYKDHIANEEVKNRIRQAIGPYEDLLPTVEKCKVKYYGHVTRYCKAQYQEKEGGRQRKRWEVNIKEGTGRNLSDTLRGRKEREMKITGDKVIRGTPTVNQTTE